MRCAAHRRLPIIFVRRLLFLVRLMVVSTLLTPKQRPRQGAQLFSAIQNTFARTNWQRKVLIGMLSRRLVVLVVVFPSFLDVKNPFSFELELVQG